MGLTLKLNNVPQPPTALQLHSDAQPLVNYTMPTNASATHLRNRSNITSAAQPPTPPAARTTSHYYTVPHKRLISNTPTLSTAAATPPQLLNRCSKHLHYTPPHTTTHHTLRAHNARERGIDRNHTRTPPTITQSHATTKCRNTPIECGSGCRVRNNLFQTK